MQASVCGEQSQEPKLKIKSGGGKVIFSVNIRLNSAVLGKLCLAREVADPWEEQAQLCYRPPADLDILLLSCKVVSRCFHSWHLVKTGAGSSYDCSVSPATSKS